VKLSELEIIKAALPATGQATAIVNWEIALIRAKVDHAKASFNSYCTVFGLKPDDLGKTFHFRGQSYQITGLNPGAPKFAVNVKRVRDGKPFRFPHREIHSLLARAA